MSTFSCFGRRSIYVVVLYNARSMAEAQGWQLCIQDLYAFCAYALLLQLCIFMLFVSKAAQYAHSTEDIIQRVLNVFIAAVPTGAPTG